jgi:hypothetical protein
MTPAQLIESFHLAFLQVLATRLNQRDYVLKGGANLRYFFGSHRYSEDIDFDAGGEESWKLEEKVDVALSAPSLTALLRRSAITIAQVTKPKQTETTQRWKLQLAVSGREETVSTKVEFSRRNGDERFQLEAVPDRVVAPYALRPPTVLHYLAAPATEQKVLALALRNEAQARDVFDLDLLFRGHPGAVARGALTSLTLTQAAEHCLELPFEAFEAQVLPFLDPDFSELYTDPAVWEQIRAYVIDQLGALDAND